MHARHIRTAIRERRFVELLYADGDGRASERRVRPIAVWNLTIGWMFSAWCELREDFRTFRLDRITRLAVTPECFAPDETKGLAAFLEKERCRG